MSLDELRSSTMDPGELNPFPSLRPFLEDESFLFFGRENQVDALVDKLAATRFLVVLGTSGSGKSSLVNSGLLPALRMGSMVRSGTAWRIAQLRPGGNPVRALANALAAEGVLFRENQSGGLTMAEIVETTLRMSKLGLIDIYEQANSAEYCNLLVVVDQFEELFRYQRAVDGREGATAFVNLLLEAAQQANYPIYIVLTMRSDFLGDCTRFSGLAEAINAGQYLVPRLTRDESRTAITGPIGVTRKAIAPSLLARLLNDFGDNPDQLPILQHALNRTWDCWRREGGTGPLEMSHYEAIGGMSHAMDMHAEQAYAELTDRQQRICEKVFKALTDRVTDGRGGRRPARLSTLCELADTAPEEVVAVIDMFRHPSRSFLTPPAWEMLAGETVIDISHEGLMRLWRRLVAWTNEEAESAKLYLRLADTAVRHATGIAGLLRDPELQIALTWRERTAPNSAWADRYHGEFPLVMAFLKASAAARDAEAGQSQELQRKEIKRAHNIAGLLGVLFLLTLAALGFVFATAR